MAYFHCASAVKAYVRASGQKSDLAIRFNDADFLYKVNNSSVGIHFRYVLGISLVRMRSDSVNFASGLNTALTIVFSASEMTYIVSSGALNSTHSLTIVLSDNDFL